MTTNDTPPAAASAEEILNAGVFVADYRPGTLGPCKIMSVDIAVARAAVAAAEQRVRAEMGAQMKSIYPGWTDLCDAVVAMGASRVEAPIDFIRRLAAERDDYRRVAQGSDVTIADLLAERDDLRRDRDNWRASHQRMAMSNMATAPPAPTPSALDSLEKEAAEASAHRQACAAQCVTNRIGAAFDSDKVGNVTIRVYRRDWDAYWASVSAEGEAIERLDARRAAEQQRGSEDAVVEEACAALAGEPAGGTTTAGIQRATIRALYRAGLLKGATDGR